MAALKKSMDQQLEIVLDKLRKAGVTLNRSKCKFSKSSVQFLGQLLDCQGIRPDPDKVKAIQQMKEPENAKQLRQFLGKANHLSKFMPNLADTTKNLHDLLVKNNHWTWAEPQQTAFVKLKNI